MALKFDPTKDVTGRNPVKTDPDVKDNVLLTITRVNVDIALQELDTNKAVEMQSEYSGHNVPRLYIEFKQTYLPNSVLAKDGKERFFVYNESPIVSFMNANNPGEARQPMVEKTLNSLYEEQFKHLLHIYKAFEGCPNYIPINSQIELDPSLPVAERLAMFNKYFNIIASGMNGSDGKSSFIDATGKPYVLVAKMIVNKNGNRLEFPAFTGTGFIEIAKFSNGTVINTFDFKASETIIIPKKAAGGSGAPIQGGMPPAISGGLADLINNA